MESCGAPLFFRIKSQSRGTQTRPGLFHRDQIRRALQMAPRLTCWVRRFPVGNPVRADDEPFWGRTYEIKREAGNHGKYLLI